MFKPGQWWHIGILQSVLECYESPTYIEIGIAEAICFNQVAPLATKAIGVDARDDCYDYIVQGDFYNMYSDEFFEEYKGPKADLIFIDGGHSYIQVRKDFENSHALLAPGGTIALHDTWSQGHDGGEDAYKILADLQELGLDHYTFKVWPGLTLVDP